MSSTDDRTRADVATRHERRPRRRVGVFVITAAVVLAADVITKVIVVAHLSGRAPVRTLGGAVYLDLARNSGAAFSLGAGFTAILSLIALAVVLILMRTARRMYSLGWAVSLGLVLGGALGNLADRIFRAPGVLRGRVVDFVSLFGPDGAHWPIFNVADSSIVCGAVLAGVLALRGIDIDGRSTRAEDD